MFSFPSMFQDRFPRLVPRLAFVLVLASLALQMMFATVGSEVALAGEITASPVSGEVTAPTGSAPAHQRQAMVPLVEDPIIVPTSGVVAIHKTDQYATRLAGAELQLLDGTTVVESWVSLADAPTIFSGLSLDTVYTVHEVSAPEGCVVGPDQTFTLTETTPVLDVAIRNECGPALPATGTIAIQQTDQDANPLPGVAFQLLQGGVVVDSWISDSSVLVLRGLALDVLYTVHQESAPAGCLLAADQSVTLTTAAPDRAMAFANDCTETPAGGSITIVKIDQYFTRRGGAEIQLIQDGVVVQSGVTATGSGEVIFSGLALDTSYTVRETVAPLGCIGGDDQLFTLTAAEPSQTMTVPNECAPPTGSLTITKTDQDGALLPGVEFELVNPDGSVFGRTTTLTDGTLVFSTLSPNVSYTVHETAPPEGCITGADLVVKLTVGEPDQARTIVNACDGTEPVPTPTDPATPQVATPTVPATTPVAIPTARVGIDPDSSSGSTTPPTRDTSSSLTVQALPKTGTGLLAHNPQLWSGLLVASVALALTGVGARLHRE